MAALELIAITAGAETSDIWNIPAGESAIFGIKRTDGETLSIGGGTAELRRIDDGGQDQPTGFGLSGACMNLMVDGPGDYLIAKGPSTEAFGVYVDGGAEGGGDE